MGGLKYKIWEVVGKLQDKADIDDLTLLLLKNRGVVSAKDRAEFFNPTHPADLSLHKLGIDEKQIQVAIKRLELAQKRGEKVIIYGDYDADGICATAVLWECLYALKFATLPYIPERFSEGYGINFESVAALKEKHPTLGLVITVDNGIVATGDIAKIQKLGVDVIVSDHHTPGKKKPAATAIVHTTKISGSAVAWVLAREIRKQFSITNSQLTIEDGLDLVAIGTIADQLPLLAENRSFVKQGLGCLNSTARPGILALLESAGIALGEIDCYTVGFIIAPRLNAMGRLVHAMESLRLVCIKDKTKARELAGTLTQTNLDRQKIVETVVSHARQVVAAKKNQGVIVIAHESYHEGVIGLAAGRLVEEFYRPAIVFSKGEKISKASARSIAGFNIIENIRKLEDLLEDGGGHPMAAGFSLQTTKIDEFIRRFEALANPQLTSELLAKKLKIDCELPLSRITWEVVEKISDFEPTGLGNPTPIFVTNDCEIMEAKLVGREGKHAKLKVKKGDRFLDAIAFGFGEYIAQLAPGTTINLAYYIEENVWNGSKSLQLRVRDLHLEHD